MKWKLYTCLHEVATSVSRVTEVGMNALPAKCERSENTDRETPATNQICRKLHSVCSLCTVDQPCLRTLCPN